MNAYPIHRTLRALMLAGFSLHGAGHANTNDALRAYQKEGVHQAGLTPRTTINTLNAASIQTQSEHQSLIDTLMQGAQGSVQTRQKPQGAEGAVLFVSFSMPDSLLFALSNEAAEFNIPVVINGLVEGDFKKTIDTFKRLNLVAKKQHLKFQGVSIDPVWFTQFHITSVPALVVTHQPKPCTSGTACINQTFDVVYGNARIKNGLELIAHKGEAAPKLAQKILEHGHV